jgi:hypothetical protein
MWEKIILALERVYCYGGLRLTLNPTRSLQTVFVAMASGVLHGYLSTLQYVDSQDKHAM